MNYVIVVSMEGSPIESQPEKGLEKTRELETLIEINEIKNRTDELEARLEKDQLEEGPRKAKLAKSIFEGLRSQGLRIAQIAAIFIGIGLAEYQNLDKSDASKDTKPKTAEKQNEVSQIERDRITKETGVDVFSLAKKMGFEVEVQVPSPNGKYILHVGQSHYVGGVETNNLALSKHIASIQRKMEIGLIGLKDLGKTNIFNEGYTVECAAKYPIDYDKDLRDQVNSIEPAENCFEKLTQVYIAETKFFKKNPGFKSDKIITGVAYFCASKAKDLKKAIEERGGLTSEMSLAFDKCIETFQPHGNLQPLGEDAVYLLGALEKMELEGSMHSLPAETEEGNRGAFKHDTELKIVSESYFKADFKTLPLKKIEELARNYYEVKKKSDQCALETREDIALKIMSEHPAGQESLSVVIYGSAHDFKNNVEEMNKRNPEQARGLIRIKNPKKI